MGAVTLGMGSAVVANLPGDSGVKGSIQQGFQAAGGMMAPLGTVIGGSAVLSELKKYNKKRRRY